MLEKAIRLQNGLIAFSTGGSFDGGTDEYRSLRTIFIAAGDTKTIVPIFIHRCRDLNQFWAFIKYEIPTYKERREFIWEAFRPLIERLESANLNPGIIPISETIGAFDQDYVASMWQKSLDRRLDDPEGAITAARTLIETVCKHILDDAGVEYPDSADLPRLWAMSAEVTNLAPNQHQEEVFRAILGNCQSIVNNLSAIRNRVGDAHGQGRRRVRPKPRHAELAVNLAGTMAAFLVETWQERNLENG